ncbi:MAG: hypothetical protein ACE5D6_06100, partial [Candidatus Zixiibacteriota bacterium]
QKEIQEYAKVMATMVKTVCPIAFEAFMDYSVNALNFSGTELIILRNYLDSFDLDKEQLQKKGLSKREVDEFFLKLSKIKKL